MGVHPRRPGIVVDLLRDVGILGDDGRLLATSTAVVAGITYNFFPFMALPLYVSLEQIDQRLIEAAQDLYASKWKAFLRVTLPLSLPGVVAGTLLTFIPAAGDFINAQLLGSPKNHMIGNVIQSKFLELTDYPAAAAMSFVLMAAILLMVALYARAVGTEKLTGMTSRESPPQSAVVRSSRSDGVGVRQAPRPDGCTSILAFIYLMLPIAVVIAFSFNNPAGRFNYTWQGFTWDNWQNWDGVPGLRSAMVLSLEIALLAQPGRDALGTLIALALVRYGFRGRGATNLLIFLPLSTPEIVLGASLLTLFLNLNVVFGFWTILIAHIMFCISFAVVTVKARLIGFDRHLEEAAMDLGANEWVDVPQGDAAADRPGHPRVAPPLLRDLDRRLRRHVLHRRIAR